MKTHVLGLPQTFEWKCGVLSYIIEQKIVNPKSIPYNQVVSDICPGQTSLSLSNFVRNLVKNNPKVQLHEYCTSYLSAPPKKSYLGSVTLAQSQLEYASEILKIKFDIVKRAAEAREAKGAKDAREAKEAKMTKKVKAQDIKIKAKATNKPKAKAKARVQSKEATDSDPESKYSVDGFKLILPKYKYK